MEKGKNVSSNQSEPLENVVKKLQLLILKGLNPTIGKPNTDQVVPYIQSIYLINEEFKTNYQTIKLMDIKVRHFDDIYKKLPLENPLEE